MGIHLNDEELLALTGLPDIHIRLYIFGIRRYMDYTNGVVGVKRRISYQSLSEVLYIEPIRGVKTPQKLSRSQLRRAVKSLERAGLILIKSHRLQLVLECLLAKQDRFIQIKADTKPTQSAVTNNNTEISTNSLENTGSNSTYAECSNTKADPTKNQKAATPPGSGITLSNESVISKVKRSCSFPKDFEIKTTHLDLAQQNGWPNPHEELDAFRDHHLARGNTMKDWDRAFYTWLRNAKRFRGMNYEKNKRHSSKSESIMRSLKSNAPNVNWESNETRRASTYGMDQ